jgi:hypothetical protein
VNYTGTDVLWGNIDMMITADKEVLKMKMKLSVGDGNGSPGSSVGMYMYINI